jgi:regulator of replication initiation timing
MTDNLLQKLEEKVLTLLTEMDRMRKELSHLKMENHSLKNETQDSTKKLQGLVTLLETLDSSEMPAMVS